MATEPNPQLDKTADDHAEGRFAPPTAVGRPRNGEQGGLDGDPDPLKLGAARTDFMPNGIRTPAVAGNPFQGNPFSRQAPRRPAG